MRVAMNLRQLRSLESDKAGPSSKALEFPSRSSRCAKCHCASSPVLIQVNGLAALTGNNIFPRKSGFRWMGLLWAGACWPDFVQILSRSSDPSTDPLFPASIAIAPSVDVLSKHCTIKILHKNIEKWKTYASRKWFQRNLQNTGAQTLPNPSAGGLCIKQVQN